MSARYDGPFLDSHQHFWDLSLQRHPWLLAMPADHPDAALKKDCLPGEYSALAADCGIVASVHVEANWDPGDPFGETLWLDSLERPKGIAGRYVAYASLGDDNAASVIEQHARHPLVVGLREILSWHPDPAKSRNASNDRLGNAGWRNNLQRAGEHGLSFDLLVTPHQFDDVARLAGDFEPMSFVLNHYGSPMDRDAEGMAFWRDGLSRLARHPNIVLKLSDPVAYDRDWTPQSLADVTHAAIEAFGPDRCLFATDYPVAGLYIGFADWMDFMRNALGRYTPDEARAIAIENAARIYRFPLA